MGGRQRPGTLGDREPREMKCCLKWEWRAEVGHNRFYMPELGFSLAVVSGGAF